MVHTEIEADEKQKTMTFNEIAAQAFVFFAAGFETSATTYCLYELAKNPSIQQRVHSEIDAVLKAHNGQLTYEAVTDMVYLEKCIDGMTFDIYSYFVFEKSILELYKSIYKYKQKPCVNIPYCRC